MKKLLLLTGLFFISFGFLSAQTSDSTSEDKEGIVLTGGLLYGGASLVGVDLEFRLHKKFTGQVGVGLLGFGAGLNLHFKEDLHSDFFSFQYYNQGIGQSHVQSLLGPTYNFRAFNFLTGSIGLGAKVMEGPAYTQIPIEFRSEILLLYSLGVYKVF